MSLADWLITGGIVLTGGTLIAAGLWLFRLMNRENDAAEVERERRREIERARLEAWERKDAERLAKRRAEKLKDKGGGSE